jgi:hypothetical protein
LVIPKRFFHCGQLATPSFAAEIALLKLAAVNVQFVILIRDRIEWFAYPFSVT